MEMWLRLATTGNVACTSNVQAVRRCHELQLTNTYRGAPARDFIARDDAFSSFFRYEGRNLPKAKRLHRTAKQALARDAIWEALTLNDQRDERRQELVEFALDVAPETAIPRVLKRIFTMEDSARYLSKFVKDKIKRHG